MTKDELLQCEINLVCAVIQQARKEYIALYRRGVNTSAIDALERWFRGPQFALWSLGVIDPDRLIRVMREEAEGDTRYKQYLGARIGRTRKE